MAKKTVAAKKRNVKVDANGQLHVHSSFNNIIVSLANSEGQIILGLLPERWVLEVQRRTLPTQHRWLLKDCAKIAYDLGLRKVKHM